jgi:hypothetical protein
VAVYLEGYTPVIKLSGATSTYYTYQVWQDAKGELKRIGSEDKTCFLGHRKDLLPKLSGPSTNVYILCGWDCDWTTIWGTFLSSLMQTPDGWASPGMSKNTVCVIILWYDWCLADSIVTKVLVSVFYVGGRDAGPFLDITGNFSQMIQGMLPDGKSFANLLALE